jgi:hypothetical protein
LLARSSYDLGLIDKGEQVMRVLLGIILGVFLTIAGAYVIDSVTTGPATAGAGAGAGADATVTRRPMVNWDVVDHNWHAFTDSVRNGWNRLTG